GNAGEGARTNHAPHQASGLLRPDIPEAGVCAQEEATPASLAVSHPRLVAARAVDGRNLAAGQTQIDRELPPMMDLVVKQEPEPFHAAILSHGAGPGEEADLSRHLFYRRGADHLAVAAVRRLQRVQEL